jgi:hypothetical protein
MDARWDSILQLRGLLAPYTADLLIGWFFLTVAFIVPWDRWANGLGVFGGLLARRILPVFSGAWEAFSLKRSLARFDELIRLGEFLKMALTAGEPPEKGLMDFLDFHPSGLQIRPSVRSLYHFLKQGLQRRGIQEGATEQSVLEKADRDLDGLFSLIYQHQESGAAVLPSLEVWLHEKRAQKDEMDELRRHTAQPMAQIFASALMPPAIALGSYLIQTELFRKGLESSLGQGAALMSLSFIVLGLFWSVRCLQGALKSGDAFRLCSSVCFELKRMSQGGFEDDDRESALLSKLVALKKKSEIYRWSRYLTHVLEKGKNLGISRSNMLHQMAQDFEKKAHREVMKGISLCSTKILLPLFLCFLPSILLALWIPMIPLIQELF